MTQTLIIRPDGTAEVLDVEATAQGLHDVVGGFLDVIGPRTPEFGSWHAYADADGHAKRLAPNPAATDFALRIGWLGAGLLVGPVVFLGERDGGEDGVLEADVPPEVVGAAVTAWGLDQ